MGDNRRIFSDNEKWYYLMRSMGDVQFVESH